MTGRTSRNHEGHEDLKATKKLDQLYAPCASCPSWSRALGVTRRDAAADYILEPLHNAHAYVVKAKHSMTTSFDRRAFLSGLGQAGAALAAGSWLEAIGYAQVSRRPTRVRIHAPQRAVFDRRVLGSFLEHL